MMEIFPETKKKFKCGQCTESFHRNFSLTLHRTVVHNGMKTLECKETGKVYNIENKVESPKRNSSDIQENIANVENGTREHKCDICQITFSKKGTLKTHVDEVHKQEKMSKCKCVKKYSAINTNLNFTQRPFMMESRNSNATFVRSLSAKRLG